jgi:hypothetical protein
MWDSTPCCDAVFWRARLAMVFPTFKNIKVIFEEEDYEDLIDYQITFLEIGAAIDIFF